MRESYTAHNRNQKSGCIKKKKKKQQGNRGERVMKSIRWSRMCEEGPASKVMREYGEEEAKRTKKERKKKKRRKSR